MKKGSLFFVTLLFLLNSTGNYFAQDSKINLSEKIKNNPSVVKGTFKNGLTYYILQNKKPEKRAELRLVVNAGSILEDDDQQGLAHFNEHMAFNGTKNFKKQEIVNFLEGIGMRFGPELNAYTSFDETVYMLQIPTEKKDIIEKGIQILGDWACNISFDNDEIDKERGVIIEEWRLGRGAQARVGDKQIPVILKNSHYAERLPIGKKEIIESFTYDKVKKFYKDWYRPDLMAVVAVGDFDVKEIEQYIRKYFESIPAVENPRPRKTFDVPKFKETFYSIETDKELPMSNAGILYKNDSYATVTYKDFKEDAMSAIFSGIIGERLDEIGLKKDPPFTMAYIAAGGNFVRPLSPAQLAVLPKDNNIELGLKAALTELERVKKFGFNQTELDRQKKEYLRSLEENVKEKDKRESSELVDRLVENYLQGETYPDEETNYGIGKQIIPAITLKDMSDFVNRYFHDDNRVVTVALPDKADIPKPTQEALAGIINSSGKEKIEAYVDKTLNEDLIPFEIKPGKIVAEKTDNKTGITELKLSNGAKVLLKPTDFKNDEILYTSFSEGGSSLYDEKDNWSIKQSTFFVSQTGVGKFSLPELNKYLTGKNVSLTPRIGLYSEGMSGSASVKDMETLFKLNYLYFTQPRKDSSVFSAIISTSEGLLKNRSLNPENVFLDTLNATIANYNKRLTPLTIEALKQIDYDKGFRIYKERFADAGGFTYVFVGSFKIEAIKPFIEKYIAGLPSLNGNEKKKDVGLTYPKGVIVKEVKKGIEPKSQVEIYFSGPMEWSRSEAFKIESLVEVVDIKLRESIREDKGGTYGVSVFSSTSKFPKGEYGIGITFGCQPQRAEELTGAVMAQIDSVINYPVKEVYVNKVKETEIKSLEKNLKENGAWMSWIRNSFGYEIPVNGFILSNEMIESLTTSVIQETAKKYFNKNNYVKVTLYPEK